MSMLEIMGAALAIPLAVLGIIGGLLTLPSSIRRFRRDRQVPGMKGVGFCVVNRSDKSDGITIRFLVVDDLMQFIRNFAKPESQGVVTKIEAVGEYYEVTMRFPVGTDFHYSLVKRK